MSPIADELPNVVACDSFTLPELSFNNSYYTEPNAKGIQMYVGDAMTQSQTVYIFTGSDGCSDESSFIITITALESPDSLDDVRECESYTLPALIFGNYFTQSNGSGKALFAGDVINISQTIYIYLGSDFCSEEKSFSVEIDPDQCAIPMTESVLMFPKFFTPNNDGINDKWKRTNTTNDVNGYVYIYDRYGKLLKQMDAYSGQWDGTYKNKRMPSTDYWYRFVHQETGNIITDHFTLKR
jgi:gliding motility-associated-like protein